jgi:pilus assembly protein Flp/PilA
MTFFKTLWCDQSGASAAEYALILAIVGSGIAIASYTLGTSISNAMGKASNCITSGNGSNC